jgi:hypothetical protein
VKQETTLKQWKSWVKKLGYGEKARAARRAPAGFTARLSHHPTSRPEPVKDISSSGIQILTRERWPIGDVVSLTVEVKRLADDQPEPRITLQAQVARHSEDGVGLKFILPEGIDPNLWEALLTSAVLLEGPQDALYTLKVLRTVLFLTRICHAQARESILMLGGELDQHRSAKAMEIAHRAEELLDAEPDADKMRAHPLLVKNILRHGSWSAGLTTQLWAGLLATSCTLDGKDQSNKAFADLVVNISNTQCRIFLVACKRALELKAQSAGPNAPRVTFTAKQMVRLSGMVDEGRIGGDVAYLFKAGIFEKNFDFTSYIPAENFDITPTPLGLQLYERCKGSFIQLD